MYPWVRTGLLGSVGRGVHRARHRADQHPRPVRDRRRRLVDHGRHPRAEADRASGATSSCVIGAAIVLRYFFWRTVNTLPPVSDLANFIPGILLYIAEIYSAIMLAISLFVIADPLEREPPPDLDEDQLPDRRRLHPDLQRGPRTARHDRHRRGRHGLSRATASRSMCSTTAAPTRSATRTIRRRPRRRAIGAWSCRPWRANSAPPISRARATSTPRPAT